MGVRSDVVPEEWPLLAHPVTLCVSWSWKPVSLGVQWGHAVTAQ